MLKKLFTKNAIINLLLGTFLLLMLFVPSAKALLMQGLMSVGLFKPNTTEKINVTSPALAGIKFKDARGSVVDLGDLKGKVVFLNFWATWCPPCLAEMPAVNKLYERYKNNPNVVFLLVDADNDFAKSQKYMDKKNYALPVFAVASNIPEIVFKGSLPTTVVFDKEGRLSYHGEGAADYASQKFVDFMEKLLKP